MKQVDKYRVVCALIQAIDTKESIKQTRDRISPDELKLSANIVHKIRDQLYTFLTVDDAK